MMKFNTEQLIEELVYINKKLVVLEKNVRNLRDASNTAMITVSSLIKVLEQQEIVSIKDVDSMSSELLSDLRKKAESLSKELQENDEKLFYEELLNSDIGGNA